MKRYLLLFVIVLCVFSTRAQVPCPDEPIVSTSNASCINPCSGTAIVKFEGINSSSLLVLDNGRVVVGNLIEGLCEGIYTVTVANTDICPVTFAIGVGAEEDTLCKALEPLVTAFDDINNQCEGVISVVFPLIESLTEATIEIRDQKINVREATGIHTLPNLCAGTYPILVTTAQNPCCRLRDVIKVANDNNPVPPVVGVSLTTSTEDICENQITLNHYNTAVKSIVDNIPYQAGEKISVCTGEHIVQIINDTDPAQLDTLLPVSPDSLLPPISIFVPNISVLKPCMGVTASIKNPRCPEPTTETNGEIFLLFRGGHPPYQYYSSIPPDSYTPEPGVVGMGFHSVDAGPFEVVVVDSTGCYGRFAYDVPSVYATCPENGSGPKCMEDLSFLTRNAYCPDSCNGLARVFAESVNPENTLSYQWSDGFNGQVRNGLCPNTYNVVITDSACMYKISGTLGYNLYSCDTCPYKLKISSLTPPTSLTACDGSATVEYSPPLPSPSANINNVVSSITWSNGTTGRTASNLCFSNYEAYLYVRIDDGPGCYDTLPITFKPVSCDSLRVSIHENKVPTLGNTCGGELEATVTGGSGNYLYQWDLDPAGPSKIKTNVCPGSHQVSVTDQYSGCITIGGIIVSPPDTLNCLTVSFDATRPSCGTKTDGSLTVKIEGGLAPYSIVYENSTNYIINTTSHTRNNLGAGVYTAVVIDANNCYGRMSVDLSAASPTCGFNECPRKVSVSATPVLCPQVCDGSVQLTVDPFFFPDNTIIWTPTQKTGRNLTGLCKGVHQFIGISTPNPLVKQCVITGSVSLGYKKPVCDNGCQLEIDTLRMTRPECQSKCDGKLEVKAKFGQAPYQYKWNNGPTTPVNQNLCPGNYYVKITDAKGCIDTFYFALPARKDVCCGTIGFPTDTDTTICPGGSVIIGVEGGDSYSWSPCNNLSSCNTPFVIASPEVTTTYQIKIHQTECNDTVIIRSYTINVATPPYFPSPSFSRDTYCVTGDINIPLSIPPPTLSGRYKIKWEPATRMSCSTCQSTQYLLNSNNPENKIAVTVTDTVTRCTYTQTGILYVNKLVGDTLVSRTEKACTGTTIYLHSLKSQGISYVEWTTVSLPGFVSKTTFEEPLELQLPATPGNYQIICKAYNSSGCYYKENITIQVSSPPLFLFTIPPVYCQDEIDVSVSGYDSYSWNPPYNVTCTNAICNTAKINMTNSPVEVTVTGYREHCTSDTTITIYRTTSGTGSKPDDINAEITYTISGCNFTFTGKPTGNGNTFKWIIYDGVPVSEHTGSVVTHQFTTPGTYKVVLIITTASCGEVEKEILVHVESENCTCP